MIEYKILTGPNAEKIEVQINREAPEGWRVSEFSTTGVAGHRWITVLLIKEPKE